MANPKKLADIDAPEAYINRELGWLSFARRVLELTLDKSQPLLERVKFCGIMGMIFDEFVMKRLGGLHQKIEKKPAHISMDGRTPRDQLKVCWKEIRQQTKILSDLIENEIRPALAKEKIHLKSFLDLSDAERDYVKRHFEETVLPILTPLAVDAAHPFPFISNLSLNIAVVITRTDGRQRFVRLKVPANRERWVALPKQRGFVPLEEVIAHNLQLMFPQASSFDTYFFRVTRGAKDNPWDRAVLEENQTEELAPGSIIGMVTAELKYRKFAGIVRLEVSHDFPKDLKNWLVEQLGTDRDLVIPVRGLLGCADLLDFRVEGKDELHHPPHVPAHHPRLKNVRRRNLDGFFDEIKKKDILIHLPYHNFDTSVLKLLQHAATDPHVLAIKLTIYRTASDSPIIKALMEAAQRGKQVAVLVEITARFDEAPNIAWGAQLERAGAHVLYGVERLKTHVKLAMIVREESDGVKRYVHVGTGNYHSGTARLYEDLGVISCHDQLGKDVSRLFNELTGGIPAQTYDMLFVAPHNMRDRFTTLIRKEAENQAAGKPSGIRAKLNQLQDRKMIRELYMASQAGVPISLNVRGLCSLRAGVAGLSETIRVFSILGRFLEHSRIYRFENGGDPLYLLGSSDLMKRNLNRRMEAITPILDSGIKAELEKILTIYEQDNTFAWDMQPDGTYKRRKPKKNEKPLTAQLAFANHHG